MTYSSRKILMSCGFGRVARVDVLSVCSSSLMISLQISMHSLQTYTPGPAISFLTSFCDLPQNEQHRSSSGLRKFAIESVTVSGTERKVRRTNLPLTPYRFQLFLAVFDHFIDQTVFLCLLGRKASVAFDVLLH